MGWAGLLLIIFLMAVIALAISTGVIYAQFASSPVKRWRDRVLALRASVRKAMLTETMKLDALDGDRRREEAAVFEDAFRALLALIPTDQLQEYPGIGPVTLDRLRTAGYRNIASLCGARVHIQGVGAKRLTDINAALNDLCQKARRRFEAGECPEANDARNAQQKLSRAYQESKVRIAARMHVITEVLEEIEGLAVHARKVTFFRYFRPLSGTPPVSAEIQERHLPNLDRRLAKAESQALHTLIGNTAKVSKPGLSASHDSQKPPSERRSNSKPAVNSRGGETPKRVDQRAPVAPASAGQGREVASSRDPCIATTGETKDRLSAREADKTLSEVIKATDQSLPLLIMERTVQFALIVARADGPLRQAERQVIHDHLQRRYRYDQALSNRAAALLSHYETASIDWDGCLRIIETSFTPQHRQTLLELGAQIIQASGADQSASIRFFEQLARRWKVDWRPSSPATVGLPAAALPAVRISSREGQAPDSRSHASQPIDHRAVLEIDPQSSLSAELIRRHYHLLQKRFDPESQKSLGPDFVAMAEKKQRNVRASAEALMKPFGVELEEQEQLAANSNLRPNQALDDIFRN